MTDISASSLGGPTALVLFLVSYLLVVFIFSALLGLGWNLESSANPTAWPQPQRYSRVFSLAFLSLLSALGGLPPFFLLGPKLALFSWLVGLGAWGSVLLSSAVLLIGWYVYWQAATGLFDAGGSFAKPSRGMSRGGALIVMACLTVPLALSGLLLDLWAFAHWIV